MRKYTFLDELNSLCNNLLQKKNRLLICITGKSGVGKSTLGKYIRKNGFGNFSKYTISVIDDGVMSMDLCYVFNKRVKIKTSQEEELLPFIELLPKRKKLIFCISTIPTEIISSADIVLHVQFKDEEERLNRLLLRDKKIKVNHLTDSSPYIKNLDYKYLINIQL